MRALGSVLAVVLLACIPQRLTAEDTGPERIEAAKSRPNVVLIFADDLGWADLGCYGSTFHETPRLDRLASQGMSFSQAYAACPVCSPTRAALMTGCWPARVGITDYIPGGRFGKLFPAPFLQELPLKEVTIAETLRAAGYKTGMYGKWHLGGEGFLPELQGFDEADSGKDGRGFSGVQRADPVTAGAIGFLERHQDEPFFLYLPHNLVHTPLLAREKLEAKYEQKAKSLKNDPAARFRPERDRQDRRIQDHAVYAAMMEDLDTQVGAVLDKLDELKLSERTIVIFTSDNGGLSTSEGSPTSNAPLRAGKGWLYEGGVRVPLIVRWPGQVQPGSRCDVPVITNDFYPTLVQMCHAPETSDTNRDGVSIVPLVTQTGTHKPRELFWHYPHYGNQGGVPGASLRDGDWKLIEFFEDDQVELYNLANDPVEAHDLAASQPSRAAEMRSRLHAWQKSVGAKMPTPNPNYSGKTEMPARDRPGGRKPKK